MTVCWVLTGKRSFFLRREAEVMYTVILDVGGGYGDQTRYLGRLEDVSRHYRWGVSPFFGKWSSLRARRMRVTSTILAIRPSPTHHRNISDSEIHFAFWHLSEVMETMPRSGFCTSYRILSIYRLLNTWIWRGRSCSPIKVILSRSKIPATVE
jgi:hypothetical protein